jgi:hypothetical protein
MMSRRTENEAKIPRSYLSISALAAPARCMGGLSHIRYLEKFFFSFLTESPAGCC